MKKYCFDTSSYIQFKRYYPQIHPKFKDDWTKFEAMIDKGLIVSPNEVFEEIEEGGDGLFDWIRTRKDKIFVLPDTAIFQKMGDLLKTHPELHDIKKKRHDADPYVVAFASLNGAIVVAEEKKIRLICEKYKIKSISLLEFFNECDFQ